jgi:hypothetical protein
MLINRGETNLSQSQPTRPSKERARIFQQRINLLNNSLHKLIRLLLLLLTSSCQDAKELAIDFREIRIDEEIYPRALQGAAWFVGGLYEV